MLYEYKGKIYVKVGNKYIQVNVTRKANGEYDVKATDKKEYVEKMPNASTIPLEKAYELNKKGSNMQSNTLNEKPRRSNILDN